MTKVYHLCLLYLSSTLCLLGQDLRSYQDSAARNNPSLKASFYRFKASLERSAQVASLEDPQLSFAYFIQPIETRVGPQLGRLSLSQRFPWFGTLNAKNRAANAEAEANYQIFLDQKAKLSHKVGQAYFDIHLWKRECQVLSEQKKLMNQFLQIQLERYQSGQVPLSELIRLQLKIEDLSTQIRIKQAEEYSLYTRFNNLLNRPDSSYIDMSLEPGLENIFGRLKYFQTSFQDSLHPQLKRLSLQAEAELAKEKAAQLGAYPNFGLGLDYVFIGERSVANLKDNGKDAIMPMISISLPLAQGKYHAARKEAQLRQEAFKLESEGLRLNFKSQYAQAYYQLKAQLELAQFFQKQGHEDEKLLQLMWTDYRNKKASIEGILSLEEKLLNDQLAEARALHQAYQQVLELEYLNASYHELD